MTLILQDGGSLIVSIDAIFGLCRKKSAGNSVRGPLSGTAVFESQHEVNSFVDLQGHSEHSQSGVCITYVHIISILFY